LFTLRRRLGSGSLSERARRWTSLTAHLRIWGAARVTAVELMASAILSRLGSLSLLHAPSPDLVRDALGAR
jgi:hypothetical protein